MHTVTVQSQPFARPTPDRLKEWVRQAQPNARLVVGERFPGAKDACGPMLTALVGELAGKGWLTPHYIRGRDGDPCQHIVQRTHRPYLKGSAL